MDKQATLNIQAIVDLLHRREPGVLEQIRNRYPDHAHLLHPGKILGSDTPAQGRLLVDLVGSTVGIVKQESAVAYQLVSSRIKSSARLRLGSSIVSSFSSGGLLTALMTGAQLQVAIVAGVLTFVSSGCILVAQYMEDYVGGQNSLRDIRDRVVRHMTEFAEIEGEIRLMDLRGKLDEVEPLIRRLNALVASIRQVQLALN